MTLVGTSVAECLPLIGGTHGSRYRLNGRDISGRTLRK